ncbi:LOW QUALITY PROTEIN: immunoglobulin iota chain-like [Lutra lutra]|uniref:LOW QUALITY PROTEIN: immunoglobulin iota chain-like n=1 Tax=Lutra lutra TaxID=9657 RepID=UPI001FD1F33F|nr:LOW QUALITY PROTEIN: immunoglobulin iota chain-like [Lutra lutra]
MVAARKQACNGSTPGRAQEGAGPALRGAQEPWQHKGDRAQHVYTMSWTPALLVLVAHCIGCGSQPGLSQPPSVSSSLGTTIHLPCTLNGDHDISIYSIYWYQQRPGHPPRFVLRYFSHSDNDQGFKIPPRFSGSKDVAKNTGYLNIAELQPEDEGMYYCAVGFQGMEKVRVMTREEKEPAAPGSQAPQDSHTVI